MSIFEYLTTFTISSKACILPFTWNISSSKKKKTFINHKINILPHMYVIFHDLKNNLQLVSPHFFLSVKKTKFICLLQNRLPPIFHSLSLSLELLLHSPPPLCTHACTSREASRDIDQNRGGEEAKASGLKKLAAKPQANFFSGEARAKAEEERKNVTNRGRFSALRGSIAPA